MSEYMVCGQRRDVRAVGPRLAAEDARRAVPVSSVRLRLVDGAGRGSLDPATTARPMRDAAKMRASMQDDYMQLRDSPKTDERDANERSQTIRLLYAGYHRRTQANSDSNDVYALAHALHLLQLGRVQEAQSLYDVLRLRPFAAQRAFARLRARTKLGRLYPDYQSFASQRREKGEGGKEKEVGDEQ